MAVFSDCFFVFNPDFDHGMMTCRDMFHMFSLTCLSCEKGEWHSVRSEFGFFFEPDFDETDKVEVGVTLHKGRDTGLVHDTQVGMLTCVHMRVSL